MKLPRSIAEKNLAELLDLLKGIHMVKEVTPRLYDYVTSFGERLSSKCFAALLRARGHQDAEAINAYDLGLITDSKFMNARPLPETYARIAEAFKPHAQKLVVVTGFIAKDKNGDITTIGRSGSDFTAAIFGAALKAQEIQVWKDVPGVMTCDPTVIKTARPLAKLSFEEASELAYYGAEVLHPATMVPAIMHGIPVRVLHTFASRCARHTHYQQGRDRSPVPGEMHRLPGRPGADQRAQRTDAGHGRLHGAPLRHL